MENRLKIIHLKENNAGTALPGELLISETSGHISVKNNNSIVSATKDLEGRLVSIDQVTKTIETINNKLNSKDDSIWRSVKTIVADVNPGLDWLKLKIESYYDSIKNMENIISTFTIFDKLYDNKAREMKIEVEKASIDIRVSEQLLINEMCNIINNIYEKYFQFMLEYEFIGNNMPSPTDIEDIKLKYNELYDKYISMRRTMFDRNFVNNISDETTHLKYTNDGEHFYPIYKGSFKEDLGNREFPRLIDVYEHIDIDSIDEAIKKFTDVDTRYMSYDEFVDKSIGFAFDNHDDVSYTPFEVFGGDKYDG